MQFNPIVWKSIQKSFCWGWFKSIPRKQTTTNTYLWRYSVNTKHYTVTINEAKMFLRKYISNFVPKGSIKGQPSKQKTIIGLTWALPGWAADACVWEMGASSHQFLCKFDQKSIGVATWKLFSFVHSPCVELTQLLNC